MESRARPPYATVSYAASFGFDFIDVEEWQTCILRRQIPGPASYDGLGCYPLTVFGQTPSLKDGLECLRQAGLVSVALVPDPVTSPSYKILAKTFEICRPFKTHYLIDRGAGPVHFAKNHRWSIRKSVRHCSFEAVELSTHLDLWWNLYQQTVRRHEVTGIQNFAPSYFAALAAMPALVALAARCEGEIVAMILWVKSGDIVYAHLEGSSPRGYEMSASYGLIATANDYFADCQVIHLGGAAGLKAECGVGLGHFKRGFANREVTAYFCGSCLDAQRYAALVNGLPASNFFPRYRQP